MDTGRVAARVARRLSRACHFVPLALAGALLVAGCATSRPPPQGATSRPPAQSAPAAPNTGVAAASTAATADARAAADTHATAPDTGAAPATTAADSATGATTGRATAATATASAGAADADSATGASTGRATGIGPTADTTAASGDSGAGGAATPANAASPRYRRSGPQGNGASTGPIDRIGAALSLTGSATLLGMAQRSGLKLAQDEINTTHLLGTTRLEIIVEDDASDKDQASAVFQRFIENSHVLAIIGPTLSDTALTVDPVAQQAGVPVLAISNAAGGITQIGNFIFRASLSESQLTPQVIASVRSRLNIRSAALLYSDTDANRAGSHGFKKALQDAGIQITSEQAFGQDDMDFSAQLDDIALTRPDALFVTASSNSAAAILIQARQHGLAHVPIVGSNAFNSDAVLHSAGDAAEGLIVGSAWSATSATTPRNEQFIQAYRTRYGVAPDQLAAQAYAGVYILAAALQDAGPGADTHSVRAALERVQQIDTPLGPFSFNAGHDPDYLPVVQVVHRGQLEPF